MLRLDAELVLNAYIGDLICSNGYCESCTSDSECGGRRCDGGRCVDCISDGDCPSTTPWCTLVPEGSVGTCYQCTVKHQCPKGSACVSAMPFGEGGKCLAGNCAGNPGSDTCFTCLALRSLDCLQCTTVKQVYDKCASKSCAPACCTTERAAAYDCLKACLGDACD